jgi:hypothetical protein
MRRLALLATVAALLSAFPISAFSQTYIQSEPDGVQDDDDYGSVDGRCEELRLSCEYRDSLGERGEGNCRRYRDACQRPARQDVCGELRAACLRKDELGEQGEGNCRRYRETCRGGRM